MKFLQGVYAQSVQIVQQRVLKAKERAKQRVFKEREKNVKNAISLYIESASAECEISTQIIYRVYIECARECTKSTQRM